MWVYYNFKKYLVCVVQMMMERGDYLKKEQMKWKGKQKQVESTLIYLV